MTLFKNKFNHFPVSETNILLSSIFHPDRPIKNYYGYTGTYSEASRVPEPIYSTGVQKSTRLNYLPSSQSCAPFQSHADCDQSNNSKGGMSFDWNYGWSSCCAGFCPSKRKCAKPDPRECNIGNDILNRDPLLAIEWDENAPNYRCTYDLHKINTAEQINVFVSKNGKDKSYNEIMSSFCEIPSHVCPEDPQEEGSMKKCSRLISLDDEGTRCRAWAATQDIKTVDNIKKEYCLHNPQSPDCRCINRVGNDLYDSAKVKNPYPDGCWYKPCSTSVYLKTSEILEDEKYCPKEMCQVIYDTNKNNDVVIKDNTNTIKCDFSQFEKSTTNTPAPKTLPIIGIFIILIIFLVVFTYH
jgi:hypothetical protein